MPRLLTFLFLFASFFGISGCGNSECQEVKEIEAPAYETLLENEKWFNYWQKQAEAEREGTIRVCRDTGKLNSKTLQFEKTGEICTDETGANRQDTLEAVKNAQTRYENSLADWRRIIKLYPDCFEPEKVIEANS